MWLSFIVSSSIYSNCVVVNLFLSVSRWLWWKHNIDGCFQDSMSLSLIISLVEVRILLLVVFSFINEVIWYNNVICLCLVTDQALVHLFIKPYFLFHIHHHYLRWYCFRLEVGDLDQHTIHAIVLKSQCHYHW